MKPKEVRFRLPYSMWEEFVRAFPGRGERSSFLRRAVEVGIEERGEEWGRIKKEISRLLREEGGGKEEEEDG